jgi:FkbM family methyltransferase
MKKIKSFFFNILAKLFSVLSKAGVNRKTPGALNIYNFLFNLFWPYKDTIEVQGSKMYVNINDVSPAMRTTLQTYASNLIHEKTTTDLFKKVVKPGNVVVDLGANIGYFTLLASKLVGSNGKVFAFEPEPKNYSYLSKNIEINNYNQTNAFQKAVSDKNGKTQLYVCLYDTGHHTINEYSGIEAYSRGRHTEKQAVDIETVSLDSFLNGKTDHVDVMKVDVEGAEALAFFGMENILKANRDIKIFLEFFPLLIKNMGSSPEEFIRKILGDYNFSIYIIPDDYNAQAGEMKKITSIEELMKFCPEKEDHLNLFLTRDNI